MSGALLTGPVKSGWSLGASVALFVEPKCRLSHVLEVTSAHPSPQTSLPSRSYLRASAFTEPTPAPQDLTGPHILNGSEHPTPIHPMSLSSQMDLGFVVLIRLSLPWGPRGQSLPALAGKAGHIIPVIKSLVI